MALIAAKSVLARYGGNLRDYPAPLGSATQISTFPRLLDHGRRYWGGALLGIRAQMPSILIH